MNSDILKGSEIFKGYAVAVDGKKIISDRNVIIIYEIIFSN